MPDEPSGGAFTLDGRPVDDDSSLPANWGQPERREGRIGDWGSSTPGRREKKKDGAESYIGGEKSGLAVQNPDEPRLGEGGGDDDGSENAIVSDILRQAADNVRDDDFGSSRVHQWGNVGHTLGSDEVESERVGEPPIQTGEPQQRTMTFWADGFSIEDGPLHRFDAPGSRQLLQAIQAGRAPMSLFEVRYDQPLQIVVEQRTNENWSQQPRTFRSFDGIGKRLGSVTPAFSGTSSPAGSTSSPVPELGATDEPKIQLDESKPATNVQIRLGDGTRVVTRVNLDHTVADIRNFIDAAHPDFRQYVLQTAFPTRELSDPETIAEAKLQNAVVIQRFF